MSELTKKEIKSPPALKATVWAHFGFYEHEDGKELDKTYAVCKTCRVKIKYLGNTTNMRNHIRRFHPALPLVEKHQPPAVDNHRTLELMTKLDANSDKAQSISKAIASFIAKDLRPYSVVENEGFRFLVHTLEPRYNVPPLHYFTDAVIPILYSQTKARIIELLKSVQRVAITCESWTSIATGSYVTVTTHYISDNWQLQSHVLHTRSMCESHTGAHVAELLSDVAEEWQLMTKDIVLVTDNANNMVVAAQVCNFPHVRCYAHTLNLASQSALKLPCVSRLLGRIRRVTTFFHRSRSAEHSLEEKQKQLGLEWHRLKTDVSTRWNSAYEMVESFLEQQLAISATLLSAQVRRGEADLCTLNEADMSNAEGFIKALKPVRDVTTLLSEESNPTMSLVAPLHAQLIENMSDNIGESPIIRDIKHAIKDDLQKNYASEEEKNTLVTAAALDPRFKELPFLTEEDRMETYRRVTAEAASLEQIWTVKIEQVEDHEENTMRAWGEEEDKPLLKREEQDHSPPAPKRKASSLLVNLLGQTFTEGRVQPKITTYDRAEEEVTRYCKAPPLSLSEDPLIWWRSHEMMFPLLSKLSKRYLCIPGTSVAAERVYSTAGDVVRAQRSTLTPEHVDQLVFLNKNLEVPAF